MIEMALFYNAGDTEIPYAIVFTIGIIHQLLGLFVIPVIIGSVIYLILGWRKIIAYDRKIAIGMLVYWGILIVFTLVNQLIHYMKY